MKSSELDLVRTILLGSLGFLLEKGRQRGGGGGGGGGGGAMMVVDSQEHESTMAQSPLQVIVHEAQRGFSGTV